MRKYYVEGYLVDKFNNVLCKEFREETMANSIEEAERNITYRVKKRLKLADNFPAKLKQVKGRHYTYF